MPSQNTKRLRIRSNKKDDDVCSVCDKPFLTYGAHIIIFLVRSDTKSLCILRRHSIRKFSLYSDTKRLEFRFDTNTNEYCQCGAEFVPGVTHQKCPGCGETTFNAKRGFCLNCLYTMPPAAVQEALKKKK